MQAMNVANFSVSVNLDLNSSASDERRESEQARKALAFSSVTLVAALSTCVLNVSTLSGAVKPSPI